MEIIEKDKSIVSIFSVILGNKYTVITTQKSSYVENFTFGQQRFVSFNLSKIRERNVQSYNVIWHSYILIPRQSFYGKRPKSLEKLFLQLWKCNLFDFIEI